MQRDDLLVWIDLEMTGLSPLDNVILEIATIITDNNLALIAQGPDLVIHQPQELLSSMNEWVLKTHTKSGLLDKVRASSLSLSQAEAQTLEFIQYYCKEQTAPLCGNSIYMDRLFLRRYMPRLEQYLHYRLIDISSVKELIRRWYKTSPHKDFKKPENHRALEDIQQSIAELAHYRKHFFVEN